MVLLDTAFLLDLEAGDGMAAEAHEKLRASFQLKFLPIVSHELVFQAEKGNTDALQFLFKEDIYRIHRIDLTRVQLDCAKKAALALLENNAVKVPNTAHLFAEAATVDNVHFIVTHSSIANSVNGERVNSLLDQCDLNKVRIVKIQKVLQGF